MSVNVLIIPENHSQDQYLVKPLIEAMFQAIGLKPRVQVCANPTIHGVNQALDKGVLSKVLARYRGMTHIFLLLVDRDGNESREAALRESERYACEVLASPSRVFLAACAWQEVEVWALLGLSDLPTGWTAKKLRAEIHPKEVYFDAYVANRRITGAGRGRETLGRQAARHYPKICKRCPEVLDLELRLRRALDARP